MLTRKSIKERLVEVLKGRTNAGARVFPSRAIPTDIHDLPVILVYLKNEDVIIFDESPRRYQRTANFTIECIELGDTDTDADERVELLMRQAEEALSEDETQGIAIDDSFLGNVNFQSEPDGQSTVAAAIMTFNVIYYVEPNPITDAPDFLQAEVGWQVGHNDESSDDVIDAKDEITIPQE